MGKVIVFVSGKGGTGKSTVCVGSAMAFAKKNNRVLLIDCDCGMRGLDLLLGVEGGLVFDACDVVKGNCGYKSAIYGQKNVPNVYVMPAPLEAEDEISPGVMKQLVGELRENYDYILIDAPAGVGTAFVSAAFPADMAVAVINAEPSSLRGCDNIRKKLSLLGIPEIRLVINKFSAEDFWNLGIYNDLDQIIDICALRLLGVVPRDNKFAALLQRGCEKYSVQDLPEAFCSIAARIGGEKVQISKSID